MKKDKLELEGEEKRIINVLYAARKPLTTYAVASRSEMAWRTAKKYLLKLTRNEYVCHGKYGKSIYWWLKV